MVTFSQGSVGKMSARWNEALAWREQDNEINWCDGVLLGVGCAFLRGEDAQYKPFAHRSHLAPQPSQPKQNFRQTKGETKITFNNFILISRLILYELSTYLKIRRHIGVG
jgi:hypothetical protein